MRVTLDALIILSGSLVALVPYMGLPRAWDDRLLVILGVFILSLGIVVRRRKYRPAQKTEAFVESAPTHHEGQ